eukprot:CAMPEP_0175172706 /NCGR_PEP_ID=MMETSP0087-20121206/31597_1 /TAXON_ID=136419 /ORGANISM="Unknown Unknown, Strain D1" /LENGTH=32 /DNA_ID= /DNA_START= /DNA_END= /DNA_ORIENTATION=
MARVARGAVRTGIARMDMKVRAADARLCGVPV